MPGGSGKQVLGIKFVPLFDVQEQTFGRDIYMNFHLVYKGSLPAANEMKKRDVLGQLPVLPGEVFFIKVGDNLCLF